MLYYPRSLSGNSTHIAIASRHTPLRACTPTGSTDNYNGQPQTSVSPLVLPAAGQRSAVGAACSHPRQPGRMSPEQHRWLGLQSAGKPRQPPPTSAATGGTSQRASNTEHYPQGSRSASTPSTSNGLQRAGLGTPRAIECSTAGGDSALLQ